MITLVTVNSLIEADQLCAELDSLEIKGFIPDEGVVGANPLYVNAVGGIRVQVHKEDLDKAREFIQEIRPVVAKRDLMCPQCKGTDIEYEKFSIRLAFLTLLLLGFPLLWIKRTCCCKSCGHRWNYKNSHKMV
ncbi:MAG: hypothetical protein GKR87_04435 [Kiritimatiellae bacterium]|nr:hypothetical protein [Kiritimatiellia bacterium]